jgi:DNA-binding SARP family transcriptional activator
MRCARRLISRAPFRESGHRLLMEVLAARGDAAEALLVYDELRRRLREDLGTAPSALTQAVYRRVLG